MSERIVCGWKYGTTAVAYPGEGGFWWMAQSEWLRQWVMGAGNFDDMSSAVAELERDYAAVDMRAAVDMVGAP